MANEATNKGIMNSWSLVSFARSHGKVQRGNFEHVDEATGAVSKFASLIFTNPSDGTRTFVSFSSKLGELSAAEISAKKADLQVVQLESGTYKLCRVGEGNWEDVDIL